MVNPGFAARRDSLEPLEVLGIKVSFIHNDLNAARGVRGGRAVLPAAQASPREHG